MGGLTELFVAQKMPPSSFEHREFLASIFVC